MPSVYDNVVPDLTKVDNFYDVGGDNHCFVYTIVDYDDPFDDRQSAEYDHKNLEKSMTNRGYMFDYESGYVTLEGFKNQLSIKLSQITSNTTSFILTISCHGKDNKLIFSDGKR